MRNLWQKKKKNREFAHSLTPRLWPPQSATKIVAQKSNQRSSLSFKKYKSSRHPVVAFGKRKTEENLTFHDNFIQCSAEKLSFSTQHFWWEYSCICSHYVLRFTSFYSMFSVGDFKVPLSWFQIRN